MKEVSSSLVTPKVQSSIQREAQILQIQWAAMVPLVRRCTSERPADRPSMSDIMELHVLRYRLIISLCECSSLYRFH